VRRLSGHTFKTPIKPESPSAPNSGLHDLCSLSSFLPHGFPGDNKAAPASNFGWPPALSNYGADLPALAVYASFAGCPASFILLGAFAFVFVFTLLGVAVPFGVAAPFGLAAVPFGVAAPLLCCKLHPIRGAALQLTHLHLRPDSSDSINRRRLQDMGRASNSPYSPNPQSLTIILPGLFPLMPGVFPQCLKSGLAMA
jgi:hypothetical protein